MQRHSIIQAMLALAACFALSSCFFLPGNFISELDVRKDGHFTYRYTGEIVFAFPDFHGLRDWKDNEVRCLEGDGKTGRPCLPDQIDHLRAIAISDRAMKGAQAAELAAIIGYDSYDPVQNAVLARRLESYPGWKSVKFKGGGVFDVEYEVSGMLDRDFIFPLIPEAPVMRPFLIVRRDAQGVVAVEAPGLSSAVFNKMAENGASRFDPAEFSRLNRINGAFNITTNGELVAHNGKIEPKTRDSSVRWSISNGASEVPSARIIADQPK